MRLTVAQALIRFLVNQYTERDGAEERLIAGTFGIFGHGNVAGVGQALLEQPDEMPYVLARNEQAMVHAAVGYARQRNRLLDLGLHVLDRPRRDEHGHRRRARHHQPPAGAAAARRHLRHARRQPGAAGARGPGLARRLGQRRVPPRVAASGTASTAPSSCPRACSPRCAC